MLLKGSNRPRLPRIKATGQAREIDPEMQKPKNRGGGFFGFWLTRFDL